MLVEVNNLFFKMLNLVNEDKYQEVQDILESILNNKSYLDKLTSDCWQFIGDISLAIGKFDLAGLAYDKANNKPGIAFVLILGGKLNEANNILISSNKSSAALWCNFLVDIFSEKWVVKQWPSFLVIRQFLEFTVYYLLLAKRTDFINLLLKKLNKLLDINIDSEKLIGYAYFHFGEIDQSIEFLKNAIKRNRFDGEIYFVLGQIYLLKNTLYEALAMLENAKLFLPHHLPTEELLEKIRIKVQD